MEENNQYFVNTYDASRTRFLSYVPTLKKYWNDVTLTSIPIDKKDGLFIDVIQANATTNQNDLIVFTSGIHGIEGYGGSAMIDVFIHEYINQLDTTNTGIMLVHAINPWGMKYYRRYNENNVDLNRNFLYDWSSFDLNANPSYDELTGFFQKDRKVGNMTFNEITFYSKLIYHLLVNGSDTIETALLSGQYNYPEGVYFGGTEDQPSTVQMKKVINNIFNSDYNNIVHIDLHTGYGPRYQMSIFSSISETMTEAEARDTFQYPQVFTPDSDEFYVTTGDITDYFYKLQQHEYPNKNVYSTTFEFGTLGDSLISSIKSLKDTIDENQLFWNGSTNHISKQIIENRYMKMFYPSEVKWRTKAVQDFKQALVGVLNYRHVLSK